MATQVVDSRIHRLAFSNHGCSPSCFKCPVTNAIGVQIVDERIHRVYVVDRDEEPRVQAVITPTDILRWAAALRWAALRWAFVPCCAADSGNGFHHVCSRPSKFPFLPLYAGWWPACFSELPAAGCPRLLSMTLWRPERRDQPGGNQPAFGSTVGVGAQLGR